MFNFSTLITLLTTILVFYLEKYFNIRESIDKNINSEIKKNIIKLKLKIPNTITSTIVFVILLLYNLNNSKVENFFLNLSNSNFSFSFIVGAIFSSIIVSILWTKLDDIITPMYFFEYLRLILLLAITICGLLYVNNNISLFMINHITNNFKILSIIINLFTYAIISGIIFLIVFLLNKFTFFFKFLDDD